jgi:hypothetical protein
MTHTERKALIESLNPDQLGKTKEDRTFRYTLLLLLADLANSHDSLAAVYRRMLNLQESKMGLPAGARQGAPGASEGGK